MLSGDEGSELDVCGEVLLETEKEVRERKQFISGASIDQRKNSSNSLETQVNKFKTFPNQKLKKNFILLKYFRFNYYSFREFSRENMRSTR